MIDYIKGELAELTPTQAVVEAGGVGYALGISLFTYSALEGRREARLWVVEVIREDAYTLWGFATREERSLFLLLTSVSGIGGATARVALSALSPSEMVGAISRGDERVLRGVKGIGPKAAQRIIVELRDKVLGLDVAPEQRAGSIDRELRDEAVAALTMLGFPPAASRKAVVRLLEGEPRMKVEQVIKAALKML
ncbi:MAG: Holliday junction branch migration protein RuvA [Prevotellaceae bacterium]|nr:Holliday junction branch migration protein RuvA [Prevotellaceae bacterium]